MNSNKTKKQLIEELLRAQEGIQQLKTERSQFRDFFEGLFETHCWDQENPEFDGGDLQGTAEKYGLIVECPAHRDDAELAEEVADGELFYFTWSPWARECHHSSGDLPAILASDSAEILADPLMGYVIGWENPDKDSKHRIVANVLIEKPQVEVMKRLTGTRGSTVAIRQINTDEQLLKSLRLLLLWAVIVQQDNKRTADKELIVSADREKELVDVLEDKLQ